MDELKKLFEAVAKEKTRNQQLQKEEILKDVIGPSGNLRAPAWKVGTEFIVGFNSELYQEMFG